MLLGNCNFNNVISMRYTYIRMANFFSLILKLTIQNVTEALKQQGTNIKGWWECEMIQPYWKRVQQFLTKLSIVLLYDPQLYYQVFPQMSLKYTPTHTKMHINVWGNFIHNCLKLEAIKFSFNRLMMKQIGVYLYNKILLSNKRKEASSHKKPWREESHRDDGYIGCS